MMQAFFGDPGQNVDPEASAEILESDSACLTDAPTSPNGPNADLIARLQARKGFGHFPGDATWFQLDQQDKDCADAAQALIKAAERIAELEAQVAESALSQSGEA